MASADGPAAPPGEMPGTVAHVATIALPADTGDFASSAVGDLGPDDVLVVLFEYDASAAGHGLFARAGMPRTLQPDDFSPSVMQRAIPGQAGCQFFFTEAGRAFCLYAVIGAYARRTALAAKVSAVLATVQISPRDAPAPTTSAPPTTAAPTTSAAPASTTTTPPTTTPTTTRP